MPPAANAPRQGWRHPSPPRQCSQLPQMPAVASVLQTSERSNQLQTSGHQLHRPVSTHSPPLCCALQQTPQCIGGYFITQTREGGLTVVYYVYWLLCVQILIGNQALYNVVDKEGRSPLDYAKAMESDSKMVALLEGIIVTMSCMHYCTLSPTPFSCREGRCKRINADIFRRRK